MVVILCRFSHLIRCESYYDTINFLFSGLFVFRKLINTGSPQDFSFVESATSFVGFILVLSLGEFSWSSLSISLGLPSASYTAGVRTKFNVGRVGGCQHIGASRAACRNAPGGCPTSRHPPTPPLCTRSNCAKKPTGTPQTMGFGNSTLSSTN